MTTRNQKLLDFYQKRFKDLDEEILHARVAIQDLGNLQYTLMSDDQIDSNLLSELDAEMIKRWKQLGSLFKDRLELAKKITILQQGEGEF